MFRWRHTNLVNSNLKFRDLGIRIHDSVICTPPQHSLLLQNFVFEFWAVWKILGVYHIFCKHSVNYLMVQNLNHLPNPTSQCNKMFSITFCRSTGNPLIPFANGNCTSVCVYTFYTLQLTVNAFSIFYHRNRSFNYSINKCD